MPGAPPSHSATAPTAGTLLTGTPCAAALAAHWPASPSRYDGSATPNPADSA